MAFAIQGEKILQKRVRKLLASGGGTTDLNTVMGDKELVAKLSSLSKPSEVNKMLRPGVREAASEVRKRAKSNAPTDSGTLKRSIASKNLTIAGKVVVAIVGPRTDRDMVVPRRMPDGRIRMVLANPAKYAHLVEFGTSKVSPQPFMRPAWDATGSQRIIARRTMHELRKAAQGRVGRVKADKAKVAALKGAAA